MLTATKSMFQSTSPSTRTHRKPGVRGVALIEALVAMLVMAFGMVALLGLIGNLRLGADLARQRGEAIRLAESQMDTMRDYSVLDKTTATTPVTSATRDYATIAPATTDVPASTVLNVPFSVTQTVTAVPGLPLKAINVTVSWSDRASVNQWVSVPSYIAGVDPSLSGALGIAPIVTPTQHAADGKIVLPPAAKNLGDGRSVLVPQGSGTVAYVFNNLTGVVTSRCTVSTGTQTASLTATSLTSTICTSANGFALWGYVRFAGDSPLTLSGLAASLASTDAMPLDLTIVAATSTATGPSYECLDNAPLTSAGPQTAVSYFCVVVPVATQLTSTTTGNAWSGQLQVSGIIPATGTSTWQICRYSGNYNGDGVISNSEHPLTYTNVTGPLGNQNFLVIKSSTSCPTGASTATGAAFFSTATIAHQPVGADTPLTVH